MPPVGSRGGRYSMKTKRLETGKRSRTGCRTCRARKVKCDERLNGCANCERLNIPCTRDSQTTASPAGPGAGSPGLTQAGLQRSRTFRSCRSCRAAKVRCSGEHPDCGRCSQRRFQCLYDDREAPQWVSKAQQSQSNSQAVGEAGVQEVTATSNAEIPASDTDTDEGDVRESQPADRARIGDVAVNSRHQGGNVSTWPLRSGRDTMAKDKSINLNWLFSTSVPDFRRLLRLVKDYFRNIHPLRAFGFVHKPSFMQRLEDQSVSERNNDILLLVICALGAKFHAARLADQKQREEGLVLHAGNQWSQKAHYLLVVGLNNPSIETIMAAVLLHEHELRIGKYASAFMLTGLVVRLAQGLQLNLETSADALGSTPQPASPSIRESRRRLMWSVYVMDAWVGSGVDELTLLDEANIQIQLPSNEQDFVLEMPTVGQYLGSAINTSHPQATPDLDLTAQFVRLISIRKKVLRFVKHLDVAKPPWLHDSEFNILQADLSRWHNSLPDNLQFTRSAVQKRKVTDQHGALLLLHLTYHQSLCDLTRIGMRELFRIREPVLFPPEQDGFLRQVQDACFDNGMAVSDILQESLKHGTGSLADTWLCVVAHDAARVLVYYLSNKMGSTTRHNDDTLRPRVSLALWANIQALQRMIPMFALARPLYIAAMKMIKRADFELPSTAEMVISGDPTPVASDNWTGASRAGSPSQLTPEHVLNPLAIYRMARKDIREGQKDGANSSLLGPPASAFSPTDESTVSAMQTPEFAEIDIPGQPALASGANYIDGAFPDTVELPTSFDDLQMYMCLPSTFGNYNGSLSFDMAASGSYPNYDDTGPSLGHPPPALGVVPGPGSAAGYSFQAGQDNLWTG